jgi:hypothetical protein
MIVDPRSRGLERIPAESSSSDLEDALVGDGKFTAIVHALVLA